MYEVEEDWDGNMTPWPVQQWHYMGGGAHKQNLAVREASHNAVAGVSLTHKAS